MPPILKDPSRPTPFYVPPPVAQSEHKGKGGRPLQDPSFASKITVSSLWHSGGDRGKIVSIDTHDSHSCGYAPVLYQRADESTPLVYPSESSSDQRHDRTFTWSTVVLALVFVVGVCIMIFFFMTASLAPVHDGDRCVALAAVGLVILLLSFLYVFYVLYCCLCGSS
ncbi:hypothetical protein V5799_029666 [Amblyomma americanum]|uniref:Uncharacterized protein n=1 Tax=Amblyomma americanum TaxID=6943 RepID=A0AAQ4ER37_AMBAM